MRYTLQDTRYKLQVTSYKLQVTSYKLQVTSYKLQVTSYKLQVHIPKAGQSFLTTLALYGCDGVDAAAVAGNMRRLNAEGRSRAAALTAKKFGLSDGSKCPRLAQPFVTGELVLPVRNLWPGGLWRVACSL